MTGWKLVFLSMAVAALMLQDTASQTINPCDFCPPDTTCVINEATGNEECINLICTLEPDPGPCPLSYPFYYFDVNFGQCLTFLYGGCEGNENRFFRSDDCYRTCKRTAPIIQDPCDFKNCAPGTTCHVNEATGFVQCIDDICTLDPAPGPCRGSIPSYFFNFATDRCEQFIYGGCRGNENRFSLLEDCRNACGVPAHAPLYL